MSTMLIARINARMRPLDRDEVYEDPLIVALEAEGLGTTCGAGTLLAENWEVEFCELEIESAKPFAEVAVRVVAVLEQAGAPRGSELWSSEGGETLAFGHFEGLGLYLNGTDLPAEVYASSDVNYVYDEINRLLAGEGSIQSFWEGPEETALYLYGRSFTAMQERISGLIESYPLCQRCRVVQIA